MKSYLMLPWSVIDLLPAAMRSFIAVSLFALSIAPLSAQQPHPFLPDVMVQHFCHASQINSGAEFDEVTVVAQRLADDNPHIHVAVTDSPLINAFEVNLSADASVICMPVALAHFMADKEGELAFIMGHEIGHATDKRCKTLKGRFRVAPLGTLLGRIGGDGNGDQRACEDRADEVGFNLMTRAGYDPNDAATALQRLSDASGVSTAGPAFLARLSALGEDHPITPDRIHHIRKLIARHSTRSGF
jgi:predicted Zn-dependent protease